MGRVLLIAVTVKVGVKEGRLVISHCVCATSFRLERTQRSEYIDRNKDAAWRYIGSAEDNKRYSTVRKLAAVRCEKVRLLRLAVVCPSGHPSRDIELIRGAKTFGLALLNLWEASTEHLI